MTITEVRKILIDKLDKDLKQDLFKWTKGKQYFIRSDKFKTQIIDLLFTKKGTTIQIEPTVRIKIKEIEEYYKSYFTRDIEYFQSIKTIGNSLLKIRKYYDQGLTIDPDENSYFLIEDYNDIVPTANGLLRLIHDYGYRYFNDTSDIFKVDKLINSNPKDISIHYSLYPMRAIIGIIVAFKTGNSKLKELKEIYKTELQDAENIYKNEFDRIVADM